MRAFHAHLDTFEYNAVLKALLLSDDLASKNQAALKLE
jgi:hypothetical protein